jgi:hypothetical protein
MVLPVSTDNTRVNILLTELKTINNINPYVAQNFESGNH